jgi:hypothetical protein
MRRVVIAMDWAAPGGLYLTEYSTYGRRADGAGAQWIAMDAIARRVGDRLW